MKKLTLWILLISLASTLPAQQYHPLIRTHAYWDVAAYEPLVFCYLSLSRTEFIDGDSLIDGHYYRLQNSYPFLGTPSWSNSICPPYVVDTIPIRGALMREDTIARKVFIYDENSIPHDQLLYDFNLSVGDTLQTNYGMLPGGPLVVYSISDTTILNGETRKIICFDQYCSQYYIESIGGWQGLSEPIMGAEFWGWDFLCLKDNEIPIWGNICNYLFLSTQTPVKQVIQITPNPVKDKLTLHFDNSSQTASIELYNLFGQKYGQAVHLQGKEQTVMDVSNVPAGIYFVRVVVDEKVVYSEKVVIN